MAIIRRACMLSGITLKLFLNQSGNDKSENLNLNIRLNNNFRLSVDNISSVSTNLKTMKAEPKDLMAAMQEA